MDNVDVDAASARGGCVVMNTPGGTRRARRSTRMAMLLAMARSIPPARRR